MRNEADVKAKLRRVLNKHEVWYAMPHQAGYGAAGVPDFLCCARGRTLAIEAKFGRNAPTVAQAGQLTAIKAAGGVALVINEQNVGEFESWLFTWLSGIPA